MTRRAFLVALLLIAANLRLSLTGVGPLLKTIQDHLGLSATEAGLLGSLPLVIFAGFAPLARFARQLGAERILLAALALLIAGILLRSEGHVGTLFGGTVLLATGMAVTNILIPVLIKTHYPERVPSITTAYATVMGMFAALASGVAVPMAQVLPGGWQTSLASWALPAALALIVWIPHARAARPAPVEITRATPTPSLWRIPVAWQVTGFMGAQSTLFYVAIPWFPAILRDNGFTPVAAGWLLTLFQAAALGAGIVIPRLIRQFADQRGLALFTSSLSLLGLLGILVAPRGATAWVILLGIGAGPSLILALSFMGLRAGTQQTAAALSLMAQGIGYLVAALGPLVFGIVHDHTGGWTFPMLCLLCVTALQAFCGFGAGRSLKI